MDGSFDFPHDIMLVIVTKMPLLQLLEFAKSSRAAYDVVRKELRSRHHRMLSRFIIDTCAFFVIMRATGSIISGSLALHYLEGDGKFTANDLDVYTPYDAFSVMVDFFKGKGYRERENKKDDLALITYPRMFRRTKALLTGVKSVLSLTNGQCKVDIIQALSPLPPYAVVHFWSTLQMNYITADGFCSMYPKLTFSGIGLLAPVALNAVTIPRYPVVKLIRKYQVRGYRFVTRQEALENHTFEIEPLPVAYVPDFVEGGETSRPDVNRGINDGRSFTLSFGTLEAPYKIGASLHESDWCIGWRLGGLWEGKLWPSKVLTFNSVTGRHVDLFGYLKDLAEKEEADYEAELAEVD